MFWIVLATGSAGWARELLATGWLGCLAGWAGLSSWAGYRSWLIRLGGFAGRFGLGWRAKLRDRRRNPGFGALSTFDSKDAKSGPH